MRLLVCGGRDYNDEFILWSVLGHLEGSGGVDELIVGDCPTGADAMARNWAVGRGHVPTVFSADWEKQGKAAGPIRNQRMLDEGKPDLVLAFPGGRGTEDMVR